MDLAAPGVRNRRPGVVTNRADWTADPVTVRVLAALADGRSLPASMLAAETGLGARVVAVAVQVLSRVGAVVSVRSGRWEYHRIADDVPYEVLEAAAPIASMRPGTALHAVRSARRCYGHPAGRFGVAVTDALRRLGHVEGHDGRVELDALPRTRMSGGVLLDDAKYRLTASGSNFLTEIDFPPPAEPTARPCIDWTEQRHHLAGELGRCLLTGMRRQGWVSDSPTQRALRLTEVGRAALRERLGVEWSET